MTEAPAMTIGAVTPWFGGKRTMAPDIVRELGPHGAYWEPFCGSMAVLMAKPECPLETVSDLHGDLINLARVIRDEDLGPAMYRKLRRTLVCREFVTEAAESCRGRRDLPAPERPDVQAAYEFFMYSWLGANGVAGTSGALRGGFNLRYTSSGGSTNKRWSSVITNLAAWRRRLRNVVIANVNARDLIPRIEDKSGTVIYLDPPYVEKGAEYIYDFAGVEEEGELSAPAPDRPMTHGELARIAGKFRHTRVVVSYYDHPMVRKLYAGWTLVKKPGTKSLISQGQRDAGKSIEAPEVLLINGESFGAEQGLFEVE